MPGSSPHARGTPDLAPHGREQLRFIPACAGNTPARPVWTRCRPVHPRMRGEHGRFVFGLGSGSGSSPHARGTPRRLICAPSSWRFIPACAGEHTYSTSLISRSISTPHPATNSELLKSNVSWLSGSGSTPADKRATDGGQKRPRYSLPTGGVMNSKPDSSKAGPPLAEPSSLSQVFTSPVPALKLGAADACQLVSIVARANRRPGTASRVRAAATRSRQPPADSRPPVRSR